MLSGAKMGPNSFIFHLLAYTKTRPWMYLRTCNLFVVDSHVSDACLLFINDTGPKSKLCLPSFGIELKS